MFHEKQDSSNKSESILLAPGEINKIGIKLWACGSLIVLNVEKWLFLGELCDLYQARIIPYFILWCVPPPKTSMWPDTVNSLD